MDNFINFLSGAIPTVILGGFILFVAIPFIWNVVRFIIEILKK